MRFKIDENLPIDLANLLEEHGHDAITVFQQDLVGASDVDILQVCRHEKRALLNLDTDFTDIRKYPPEDYFGLIIFRLKKQDKPYVLAIGNRLIELFQKEPLEHHLWLVEKERIRISGKDKP